MITLTEIYDWQQAKWRSKLEKLNAKLHVVNFAIEREVDDTYSLSQHAAIEGMQIFAQRVEEMWQSRKEALKKDAPHWNFDTRYRIKTTGEPTGKQISRQHLVGENYQKEVVDVRDYRGNTLAYALLEPPYNINIKLDATLGTEQYYATKTKLFTELYREFVNEFLQLKDFDEENYVTYEWSDDWSNFFDAGKEWWGCFFWTIYNKQTHTIIVIGASATD